MKRLALVAVCLALTNAFVARPRCEWTKTPPSILQAPNPTSVPACPTTLTQRCAVGREEPFGDERSGSLFDRLRRQLGAAVISAALVATPVTLSVSQGPGRQEASGMLGGIRLERLPFLVAKANILAPTFCMCPTFSFYSSFLLRSLSPHLFCRLSRATAVHLLRPIHRPPITKPPSSRRWVLRCMFWWSGASPENLFSRIVV